MLSIPMANYTFTGMLPGIVPTGEKEHVTAIKHVDSYTTICIWALTVELHSSSFTKVLFR